VRRRLEDMSCNDLNQGVRPQAENLLRQLHSDLSRTEERTRELIDQGIIADRINHDERCVSPSDFGFHNAIRTSNGIRFIDFEFAGWDDPAKTVTDFMLHPRVPTTKKGFTLLKSIAPPLRKPVANRCMVIAPILRLKWICIILGVLIPSRLEQIMTVSPHMDRNRLIDLQITKATTYKDNTTHVYALCD
jgi:hypothetical protein